ncbi:MAG: immunity 53 family protein [Gammaproteobacteria bacterium]
MTILDDLQRWYAEHCNGDWEHSFGVSIGTLDNPGWSVEIDLAETALQDATFREISRLEPETDWIRCWVEGMKFKGVGDPGKLEEIITMFLAWARAQPTFQADGPASGGSIS